MNDPRPLAWHDGSWLEGQLSGPGRTRTDDLPGVSGARYQLRYGPAVEGTRAVRRRAAHPGSGSSA